MQITHWSVVQLLLAAGISRRLNRNMIVRSVGCHNSYYTRVQDIPEFMELVKEFKKIEVTDDIKEISRRTLYRMVAKFILQVGENNE